MKKVEGLAWAAWLLAAWAWWTRNLPTGDVTPLPLMADSSFVAEFSHDLLAGKAPGWSFPPAPSIFPEVPFHLILEWLTGDWRVAMFCGGLAICLGATIALRVATQTPVAVALMAVAMALTSHGELRAPIGLLIDGNHGWTAVLAFVGVWWPNPRRRWLQIGCAVLVAASDPWLHVYLSAPLIVLSVLRRRPVGVVWVASALVGSVVGALLLPHGSMGQYLNVAPMRIVASLGIVASHLLHNAVAAVMLLVGLLAVGVRGKPLPVLSAAAAMTVTIAWALFIDEFSVRYWGVVLLGGVAGLSLLGVARAQWIAAAALLVCGADFASIEPSSRLPLRGWTPPFVRCLQARQVHAGVGDYWSSRQGRLADLVMVSVTEDGAWNPWISPRRRVESLERVEFVVLSGLHEQAFADERARGTVETCGGLEVLYPASADAAALALSLRAQESTAMGRSSRP